MISGHDGSLRIRVHSWPKQYMGHEWTRMHTDKTVLLASPVGSALLIESFFEAVDLAFGLVHQISGSGGIACVKGVVGALQEGGHQACGLRPIAAQAQSAGGLCPLKPLKRAANCPRARRYHHQRFTDLLEFRARGCIGLRWGGCGWLLLRDDGRLRWRLYR